MDKKKFIEILIVFVISLAVVVIVGKMLLDNTGKVNQGEYRISDVVVDSRIEVLKKQGEEVQDLSNMVLDINQKNNLTLLINKKDGIKNINISNIKIDSPIKQGKIYIQQENRDKVYDINEESVVDIYLEEQDDQCYIDLNIVNENCLTDVNVPSNTNVVTFDGTILELLNQKMTDFIFGIDFDLNIYDELGNKNVCNVKLKLPDEELATNGISIKRDELSNYIFRIKK